MTATHSSTTWLRRFRDDVARGNAVQYFFIQPHVQNKSEPKCKPECKHIEREKLCHADTRSRMKGRAVSLRSNLKKSSECRLQSVGKKFADRSWEACTFCETTTERAPSKLNILQENYSKMYLKAKRGEMEEWKTGLLVCSIWNCWHAGQLQLMCETEQEDKWWKDGQHRKRQWFGNIDMQSGFIVWRIGGKLRMSRAQELTLDL